MAQGERIKVLLTFTRAQWNVIKRRSPAQGNMNAEIVYALLAQYFAETGTDYPDDLPKPVAVKPRKVK